MTVVLTGSDSRIIKTSMKRFAGRRGKSDKVDFIFYPLSFKEFVILKKPGLTSFCKKISDTRITSNIPEYPQQHSLLTSLFYEYALHGGYLPAISDFMLTGTISKAVITTYVEWIIGDILKHNKSEQYLFEIFKGIKKTYASQVSWNTLSKHLSIDHHKTVSDYCLLLQSTHVLNILEALVEDKLTGAPKKNRKLYFCDPFILHSVYCFINQKYLLPTTDELKNSPDFFSRLAETIVIDHCKRHTPTFYIKGQKGEVDVSVIQNKRFYPIEIKWTKQLRSEDLKQIKQYPDGFVLVPQEKQKKLERLDIIPLVRFLIKISDKFIL